MIVIGSDVGESGVEGECEFVALQRHASILVGFAILSEFRTKERIAVEEDRHQPEDHPVLLAEFLDRLIDDVEINSGLFLGRRTQCQCFKEKLNDSLQLFITHARGFHQLVDRRQRTFDFLCIKYEIQPPIFSGDRLDVIGKLVGRGRGAKGHVTQYLFRDAGNLQGLGTVGRVKKWIVAQAMVANHGKAGLEAADTNAVGIFESAQKLIEAEIDLGFPFEIRRDVVAMGPKSRTLRIVFPFQADEIVQPDHLFLRMNAPDARRSGCGFEDFRQGAKEQIVIQMIAFDGTHVFGEPALVLHRRGQFTGDPRRKLPTLQQRRLVGFLPRRHFLQGHLFPNAFPQTGIVGRNIAETLQ